MENYNLAIETIKITTSTFIAWMLSHLGASYKSIVVLICFMSVDTIVGWAVAKYKGEWKSSKARWGFVGKIIELMFVAMLYLLDWMFAIDCLKYIGTYYFIICEGASFVENIAKINNNIPDGLVELLKAFQSSIGTNIVKWAKKTLDKLTKE
jgi:toxin secretion/phage lysis holin